MRINRIPLSLEVERVIYLLMMTLIGITLASSIVFIFKTSDTAQKGYLLRQHQLLNEQLKSENRDLKQRILDIQAFQNLLRNEIFRHMEEAQAKVFLPK